MAKKIDPKAKAKRQKIFAAARQGRTWYTLRPAAVAEAI